MLGPPPLVAPADVAGPLSPPTPPAPPPFVGSDALMPVPALAPPPPMAPVPPVAAGPGMLPAIAAANVAQQQAAIDTGAVVEQNAQETAQAHEEARQKHEAAAEETRQLQERQARANDAAHAETQKALDTARTAHIPDFWEGKEGRHTELRIAAFFGGIAQGMLGLNSNSILDKINHDVDAYHRQQKDRIDNLYKFAEIKGRAEGDLRERHARELTTLQAKYGATKLAIAARIDRQAALGQGRVDQAKAAALSAKLAAEGEEAILKATDDLSQINLRNAQAAHLRAGSGGGGGGAGAGKVAQYIKDHPDDQPGAYALAEKLGFKGMKGVSLVDKLQNDYKTGKGGGAGGEEDEKTTVRAEKNDPSGAPAGSVIGRVPSGKGGAQGFAKQDAEYGRAIGQLEALAKDIEEHGERVFAPSKVKRRETLMNNATIGVGTVSPLGKTDTALGEEKGSIGGTGGSWSIMGANGDAVKSKIEELKEQRLRYRDQTLIPIKGAASGGATLAPATAAAQTREVNGVTYYKVPGGWSDAKPGQ